jgi:putative transposase
MTVVRGNHCAYDIHYHLVCAVKYRKALLDEKITKLLSFLSTQIQERYEIEFEAMGCDKDHIHLLVSAHPKTSPTEIVKIWKSITARELFKSFPELKRELWGGSFWSDGYFVSTVGSRGNWNVVSNYVKNQGHKPEDYLQRLF